MLSLVGEDIFLTVKINWLIELCGTFVPIATSFLGSFVPTISDRIREAREGLGLSQQVMADRCGIAARSQRNYESGERLPDAAYLAAAAAAGADILYIVTGQRSQPVPPQTLLPEDERIMLDNYRHAPSGVQAGVKTTLGAFASSTGTARRRKTG